MSLIAFTCDVVRDIPAEDAYGGQTVVTEVVYLGLSASFNYYPSRGGRAERERFEATSQMRGPGVETRTIGELFFDPKPDGVEILVNDRIVAIPPVKGVPLELSVIAVRTYEVSLQLDVESVDP